MIPKTYAEKTIQSRLSYEIVGSKTEVHTAFGRIDLMTDTEIIEIKNWQFWKFGLGQLIAYSPYFPTRSLRLHCFGKIDTPTRQSIIRLFELLPLKITLTWE